MYSLQSLVHHDLNSISISVLYLTYMFHLNCVETILCLLNYYSRSLASLCSRRVNITRNLKAVTCLGASLVATPLH